MGRERNESLPGLRSFACGLYVIFYVPTQDGIEVVRVIDGRQDLMKIFPP